MTLFLDANAHLPLHPKALQAFMEFNNSLGGHGHPMSHGKPGREAASAMEAARDATARLIGAKNRNQIVFTSTATQACEWGLELMYNQGFDKVYTTTVEHKSVAIKARELFGNNDLFINKDGIVSCSFQPPEKNSAFVCVHVQNEIGTIQAIDAIPVPFFSDMSQSLGKIPVNVSNIPNLKVAAFGTHKFGGPVGVGVLYLQDEKWWSPFGLGSRYHRDRPGTPDVGMVVAASVALEQAIQTLPMRYERALTFRSVVEDALSTMKIEILGANASRVPHTTFMQVGGKMGPYIITQMESENIYIGSGSACGSFYMNSNPTATALGYGGKAQDYMRISQWGDYGEREARKVAETLFKYCPKPERKS